MMFIPTSIEEIHERMKREGLFEHFSDSIVLLQLFIS